MELALVLVDNICGELYCDNGSVVNVLNMVAIYLDDLSDTEWVRFVETSVDGGRVVCNALVVCSIDRLFVVV